MLVHYFLKRLSPLLFLKSNNFYGKRYSMTQRTVTNLKIIRNFFLAFLLAIGLSIVSGTGNLRAEGCSGTYPKLTEDLFKHLAALVDFMKSDDRTKLIQNYIETNNLDNETIYQAIYKLNAHIESNLFPDLQHLENTYAECIDQIRFTDEELALFVQYFPDTASMMGERKKSQ
jgi:hypothetical protein